MIMKSSWHCSLQSWPPASQIFLTLHHVIDMNLKNFKPDSVSVFLNDVWSYCISIFLSPCCTAYVSHIFCRPILFRICPADIQYWLSSCYTVYSTVQYVYVSYIPLYSMICLPPYLIFPPGSI